MDSLEFKDCVERLKSNVQALEALSVAKKRKSARAKAALFRQRLEENQFDLGLLCDLLDELADGVTP